jgi:Subtilisin-like serine proteases
MSLRKILHQSLAILLSTAVLFGSTTTCLATQNYKISDVDKTDRFIIKYKVSDNSSQVFAAIKGKAVSAKRLEKNGDNKLQLVSTKTKMNKSELLDDLKQKGLDSNIEYIQPDYPISLSSNDTYFNEQWALQNNSTTGYVNQNVSSAWETTQGEGVVVAVIDTGIDITHEDLSENIWINDEGIPGNGVDDDDNGYIDDISGWDFIDNVN